MNLNLILKTIYITTLCLLVGFSAYAGDVNNPDHLPLVDVTDSLLREHPELNAVGQVEKRKSNGKLSSGQGTVVYQTKCQAVVLTAAHVVSQVSSGKHSSKSILTIHS